MCVLVLIIGEKSKDAKNSWLYYKGIVLYISVPAQLQHCVFLIVQLQGLWKFGVVEVLAESVCYFKSLKCESVTFINCLCCPLMKKKKT